MRTIGIDLGITGEHQAVVADERGQAMGGACRLTTDPADLDALLDRAQAGAEAEEPLRMVMEPTGLSWFPIASYYSQRGVIIHLVNTQQVSDLRKFYRKHARSDRISARVLTRLPWVNPEALHALRLAQADYLSGQRWCKQQEQLAHMMTAIKNRVQAWERAYWPGLEQVVGDLFAAWVRRWREAWYDPWLLQEVEPGRLVDFLVEAGADPEQAEELAVALQTVARRAVDLFGTPQGSASPHLDYATLQDQVLRELRVLALCEAEHHQVQQQVQRLYRRLYPSRHLESIRGVGEQGAAVYFFFIHDVHRFASHKQFRGWSGMIPRSDQSGDAQKKGLAITAAGPDLIKKYAYINAEVARQWDPQLAAIYYDQMVNKGQHHNQAICACATHLLDRVRAVLRDDRPYQLRDVDGTPLTRHQARAIVLKRYQVPKEVRQRTTQRTRKRHRDQRAEQKRKRRSHPVR